MSTMDLIGVGFGTILTPTGIFLMFIGVAVGIVFGALPGLSATMAIALFLPVTYAMASSDAMTLLMALFIGAISGGLISAILLHIPGTPSSVATCFDGHPLARNGQAAKALGIGVVFSFLGTVFSTILLMFIAPQIARVAINFGSFEFFSIAIFSLTMIATLSSGNMVKGVMSGVVGFMFSTVGTDTIGSCTRFTFGSTYLKGGFDMLAVMVGLFAVGEIISAAQTSRHNNEQLTAQPSMKGIRGFGFSLKEFFGQGVNALRSALIGMGIGILPGIGGATSNVLAYTVAKNSDKHPERFGTGCIDGVVASETANNATIGGAMVPLLTLGIPGDTTTAMLLGALTLHGLTPGPLLFQNQADIVYGIFAAMLVCSVIMLFMEFFGLRIFVKLLNIPKYILLPCVFVLCVIGAYALKNNMSQVIACLIFGAIGFAFKKFNIPTTPFILGFILGPLTEINYRRGLIRTKGSFLPFLTSPISAVFLGIAVLVIVAAIVKPMLDKRKAARQG
ncbi:MAG: tripartite tricarboxylate transporter permease [Candidatus Limiplasma sp.]|nr:tripartite tricarboxylate transporter permease [Candidatus Limiplasma sp.]